MSHRPGLILAFNKTRFQHYIKDYLELKFFIFIKKKCLHREFSDEDFPITLNSYWSYVRMLIMLR